MSPFRNLAPALASAACLTMAAGPADAQIRPFGRQYTQFSEKDLRLMGEEANLLLEKGKVGSVGSWSNEDSGNFGTMELERAFTAEGIPCKQLDHVVKFKGQQDAVLLRLNYCRVENEWKLAR